VTDGTAANRDKYYGLIERNPTYNRYTMSLIAQLSPVDYLENALYPSVLLTI